ncbi:hypothetical protein CRV15_19920 [Streptomyces clavuligerus]|nr:hypothetical protein D1794_20555 [Streptomyces clavuligerus]QCS07680.1 hypothetical protein CRV15_19920 [Streptomyces clavuligerus]
MPERAPTVDRARFLVPRNLRALSAFGTRGTPSAHSPAGRRQTSAQRRRPGLRRPCGGPGRSVRAGPRPAPGRSSGRCGRPR